MKTLLIYDSKRGGTKEIVEMISKKLTYQHTLLPINKLSEDNISEYDQILFTAPTYAGNLRKSAREFLQENCSMLKIKRLFLVNTGIQFEQDKVNTQLTSIFPEELRNHAITTVFLGGICRIPDMNLFEKIILKKVFSDNDVSFNGKETYRQLDSKKIDALISMMNQ